MNLYTQSIVLIEENGEMSEEFLRGKQSARSA